MAAADGGADAGDPMQSQEAAGSAGSRAAPTRPRWRRPSVDDAGVPPSERLMPAADSGAAQAGTDSRMTPAIGDGGLTMADAGGSTSTPSADSGTSDPDDAGSD